MRSNKQKQKRPTFQPEKEDIRRPFVEHLAELRSRAIHVALSILFFGTAGYFVQQKIVKFILEPARGQHFIYTSPGGGIGFLFQICIDVGLILSLPLLVYEILEFLKPLIEYRARRFIRNCVFVSLNLALIGVAFGYFLGLPLAMHFLGHQFSTKQITPLLTLSEYMTFVSLYLGGSAMLFQIPLVLIIINRFKPQKPKKLLGLERWVIITAFIVSMIMAPTVNIIDQLIIAGPIIIAYQIGILMVWYSNRGKTYPKHIQQLIEADRALQQERDKFLSTTKFIQLFDIDNRSDTETIQS